MQKEPFKVYIRKPETNPEKKFRVKERASENGRMTIKRGPVYRRRERKEGPAIVPGETIIEMRVPIKISSYIGKGGIGMVYKGHNLHDERREFAVKISNKPDDGYELTDEATTASRSGNKNVIGTTLFTDPKSNYKYLAMVSHFIRGKNLHTLLDYHAQRGELLPIEFCALAGHRLAKRLKAIHRNGEIHGDMGLDQAIIQDELELIDARGLPEKGVTDVAGKTCYLSPEYVRIWEKLDKIKKRYDWLKEKIEKGDFSEKEAQKLIQNAKESEDLVYYTDFAPLDLSKIDIFGTGIMIYFLATGVNPLLGSDTSLNYRYGIQPADNITKAYDVNIDIPRTLSDILASATRENPSERPSAKELYARFHHYLFGEPEVKGAGLNDDTFFFYLKYLEMRDLLEKGKNLDDEEVKPYLRWFPNGVSDDVPIDPNNDEGLLRKVALGKYRKQAQEEYPGKHLEDTPFAKDICYGNLKRKVEDVFGSDDLEAGLRNYYKSLTVQNYQASLDAIEEKIEKAMKKGESDIIHKLENERSQLQEQRDLDIIEGNRAHISDIRDALIEYHTKTDKDGTKSFNEKKYYEGIVEGIRTHHSKSFQITR